MTADRDAPEEIVWQGKYVVAKTRGRWEYVGRARNIRAAVILATIGDDVILIEQYRVPLGRNCIELPAGLIGDEDGAEDEDDLVAAGRELEEETGYRAGRLEDCGTYYSSPGMVSESFTLVRATQLERVGEGGGTESEDITVHRIPRTELKRFLDGKRGEGCGIDVRLLMLLGQDIISGERQ
ncbi:NUDIX hydrolase [Erythrobacter sp. QSSC1-22B]|uniref:NUDIX hydrolase n=1 Tax=Erythrobacter sp. QSSC1-22B TaxID=1860125 RepID=UPI0008055D68|nr:NUDIX hydrolase [Erythrobacter sp. QSSC1-22B]OBX20771.1 NUDIX hydrolase [Erythrobacter sp. QSSC1-22B]